MPRMPYPLPSLSHEAVENRQTKSLKTASVVADAPKFISIQMKCSNAAALQGSELTLSHI